MASPLGTVFSTIDSYKRRAKALAEAAYTDPAGTLRSQLANTVNKAKQQSDMASALYKDASGKPTFDPNKWSPTAAAVHDELVGDAMGGVIGATAWHGSPFKFDRPDPSKMGTGEGAQVYGKGFYAAERPGIARDYRKNLTAAHMMDDIGERYSLSDDLTTAYHEFMRDPKVPLDQKRFMSRLNQEDWLGYDSPQSAIHNALSDKSGHVIERPLALAGENLGHLYKMDIPDPHVAQMVDWDKPLFDQQGLMSRVESASNDPDKVALRKTLDIMGRNPTVRTGETLMNTLPFQAAKESTSYAKQKAMVDVAEALQGAGVPGVKYLDRASRSPRVPVESKTRNYVVFPEYQKDIQMLQRNNTPLAPQYVGDPSVLIDVLRNWK